jgi:choice-of-anchor C domain-containing protein
VEWVHTSHYRPAGGSFSIDLAGTTGDGVLSQSFPTVPGASYTLTFDLAGNPDGPPTVKTMEVRVAGTTTPFSFSIAGKTATNMGWVTRTVSFTATAATTLLEFQSTLGPAASYGCCIDNVRVTQVGLANIGARRALLDYAASVHTTGTTTAPTLLQSTDDISFLRHDGIIVGNYNNEPVRLSDVTDGSSTTILLGEKSLHFTRLGNEVGDSLGWAVGCDVNIVRTGELAPSRDYTLPCGPGNTDEHGCSQARFGAEHPSSFNVLYADGSVRSLKYGVDLTTFRNLITRAEGVAPNLVEE